MKSSFSATRLANAVTLNMTGIVLSGGENRRMAGTSIPEGCRHPHDRTLLRSLKDVFQDIIIVTNAPHLIRPMV
jgi:molybdopterin-guanine dinucleotide biosynthesis protein A